MNILHIRPFIEPGGVSKYIGTLSDGLCMRGHKIILACQDGDLHKRELQTCIIYKDIPLSPSSINNLIPSIMQINHIIKKERIQIINTHHRFASIVGKISSLLTGVPLISTVHEFKYDQSWMTTLGFGHYIVAISQTIKDHVILQSRISPDRIKVIRIGITPSNPLTSYQEESLRKRLELDPACYLIGCIGRLNSEKGQSYLLEAIPDIVRYFPKTQFIFVGDGSDKQGLVNWVKKMGLNQYVKFLGWRNDAGDIMDVLDLIVIPSITEGLGIVALEALTHKKPVIASRVGGLPETIKEEETGLLVPPGDPLALSEAILRLLKNPDLCKRIGENGYQTIMTGYSVSRMLDESESLYQTAIGKLNN
jgi:glycosyltransferase involved in cell wall biosynthesis